MGWWWGGRGGRGEGWREWGADTKKRDGYGEKDGGRAG